MDREISDLRGVNAALAFALFQLLDAHPNREALLRKWDAEAMLVLPDQAARMPQDPVLVDAMMRTLNALRAAVQPDEPQQRAAALTDALLDSLRHRSGG